MDNGNNDKLDFKTENEDCLETFDNTTVVEENHLSESIVSGENLEVIEDNGCASFIAENYSPLKKRKKGRPSLVLACFGLFLSFFNIGIVFSLISFVLSLIGVVNDKKSTTFKWAFIISIIGLIFSTLFIVGYVYFSSKGNPFPD